MENEKSSIKEAYRVIANAYAQYEALGELKAALQYLVNADKYLEEKEAELKTMNKEIDTVGTKLKTLKKNYANLDDRHADKVKQFEIGFSEQLKIAQEKMDSEAEIFNAFLEKNQATINKIKDSNNSYQKQFNVRKLQLENEIAAIVSEKDKQEKALSSVKAKLQAVIGGIDNG